MKTCVSHLINNGKRQKGTCIVATAVSFVAVAAATDVVLGWAKFRRIIQNSFKFQMQTVLSVLKKKFGSDSNSELLPPLNLAEFN